MFAAELAVVTNDQPTIHDNSLVRFVGICFRNKKLSIAAATTTSFTTVLTNRSILSTATAININ